MTNVLHHAPRCNPTPNRPALAMSAGCEAVRWGETVYTFTLKQRMVVAALREARELGVHWVSGDALMEAAESDNNRLRDLFRGHPAWGTLIVSGLQAGGRAGMYRLAEPPESPMADGADFESSQSADQTHEVFVAFYTRRAAGGRPDAWLTVMPADPEDEGQPDFPWGVRATRLPDFSLPPGVPAVATAIRSVAMRLYGGHDGGHGLPTHVHVVDASGVAELIGEVAAVRASWPKFAVAGDRTASPGVETLSRATGYSEAQVRVALGYLAAGLL